MTDIKQDTIPSLPAVIPPTSHLNFLRNWWHRSDKTSEIAESRLLGRYLTPNVTAKIDRVDIGGKNRLINTLIVEKASEKDSNRGQIQHGFTNDEGSAKK